MSCFKSATAEVFSGTAGFLLVVKVTAFSGIVAPALEEGKAPFDPADVLPVIISHSVPGGGTSILQLTRNLKSDDEFTSVEVFCGDQKKGTLISIVKIDK